LIFLLSVDECLCCFFLPRVDRCRCFFLIDFRSKINSLVVTVAL
jgi:hypothetical protein